MNRIIGFDLIRCVSIIMAVIIHVRIAISAIHQKDYTNSFPLPDPVDLFFILSGYLVGLIFIKEVEKNKFISVGNLFSFWIMRWFRIIPLYYFLLIVIIILSKIVGNSWSLPINNFLFIQSLYKITGKEVLSESWSLAVEEWFYIFFPLLSYIIYHLCFINIKKTILFTLIFMFIFSFLFKLFYFNTNSTRTFDAFNETRIIVLGRLDTISIGIFGAYISYYYAGFWQKYKTVFFWIGFLAWLVLGVNYSNFTHALWLKKYTSINFIFWWIFYFQLNGLFILMMLPKLECLKMKETILKRFILYISKISFAVYLIHNKFILIPLSLAYYTLKANHIVLFILFYLSIVLIIAHLLHHKIEIKFLSIRSRMKIYFNLHLNDMLYKMHEFVFNNRK